MLVPEKISRTKVILSSVYFIYIRTHARAKRARTHAKITYDLHESVGKARAVQYYLKLN